MRTRGCAVLLMVTLLSGCRTPDPSVQLLESELRWREDQMYWMDDQLERCARELDSCRRSNQALREQLAGRSVTGAPQRSTNQTAPHIPSTPSQDQAPAPRSGPPTIEPDESELTIPKIELGVPEQPEPVPRREPEDATPQQVPPAEPVFPELEDRSQLEFVPARPAEIAINPRLTGPYQKTTGEQGLMVVIEPRDRKGVYVPVPGELEVEVFEREPTGDQSIAAFWKLTPVEVAASFRHTRLGRGVHLELPWPGGHPPRLPANLVCRYRTADGPVLEARRKLMPSVTRDHDDQTAPRVPWRPYR